MNARAPATAAARCGTLFLLPVPLAADPADVAELSALLPGLPALVLERAATLSVFVAENARSARAFLKAVAPRRVLAEVQVLEVAGAHAAPVERLLAPLLAGSDVGLLSESGCPGIADPGAAVVAAAHAQGIEVVALPGPSSILLTLMASGCTGQRFAFHGYLPIEQAALQQRLRELEARSARDDETELWIETPYRAERMLAAALHNCAGDTRLAVGLDLTLPSQAVRAMSVSQWRAVHREPLGKRLAVFALQAGAAGLGAAPTRARAATSAAPAPGRRRRAGAQSTRRPRRRAA